jgi:hypothetical protein
VDEREVAAQQDGKGATGLSVMVREAGRANCSRGAGCYPERRDETAVKEHRRGRKRSGVLQGVDDHSHDSDQCRCCFERHLGEKSHGGLGERSVAAADVRVDKRHAQEEGRRRRSRQRAESCQPERASLRAAIHCATCRLHEQEELEEANHHAQDEGDELREAPVAGARAVERVAVDEWSGGEEGLHHDERQQDLQHGAVERRGSLHGCRGGRSRRVEDG